MSTGDSYTFKIKWSYEINDRMKLVEEVVRIFS